MDLGWKYKEIEAGVGGNLEHFLREMFPQRPVADIAASLGISRATLGVWLKKLGLAHTRAEANRLAWAHHKWDRGLASERAYATNFHKSAQGRPNAQKGKPLPKIWRDRISQGLTARCLPSNQHPGWKGGGPHKYGPGWKRAKRLAHERAQGRCERCHRSQRVLKHPLHVHHKIPVRYFKVPKDAHALPNLLVVCHPCHHREEAKSVAALPLFVETKRQAHP